MDEGDALLEVLGSRLLLGQLERMCDIPFGAGLHSDHMLLPAAGA